MSKYERDLLANILKLPDLVRAQFASEILASLDDGQSDADAGERWGAEIERRVDDVLNGTAELIDADVVHADLTMRLRAAR